MIIVGWLFIVTGVFFFLSGTIALLRFPDLYTRLHALTKADNLGLGFIVTGLAIHEQSLLIAIKLFFIWLLILIASASVSYLIGRSARLTGHTTETKR